MIQLEKLAVIGAGTMGRGIAMWFVQQGVSVELIDTSLDVVQKSLGSIYNSWDKLKLKGKFSTSQVEDFKKNLQARKLEEISTDCNLVIEAVVEDLGIKKNLFLILDQILDKTSIIASNTSSFPITLLSEDVSIERKKRFVGLHFFNPAPIMKLVEVICPTELNENVAKDIALWLSQKGKIPAVCLDRPGFIVNRIARNFYGEALRIAGCDDQKRYQKIDNVLKEVGGFRMGPFELMDLIGIDVNLDVTRSVWHAFDDVPRFAPHFLQQQMVEKGRLGKKTGKGFFVYE